MALRNSEGAEDSNSHLFDVLLLEGIRRGPWGDPYWPRNKTDTSFHQDEDDEVMPEGIVTLTKEGGCLDSNPYTPNSLSISSGS